MNCRILAAVSVAALLFAEPALAQRQGWYLGLGIGFSELDSDFNWQSGPSTSPISMDADSAPVFNAAVGFKMPNGIRVELQPTYSNYSYGSEDPFPGDVTVSGAFLNGAFDFPVGGGFSITGGVGIGYLVQDVEVRNSNFTIADGAEGGFAWQLIGGGSYLLGDNAEIQLDYRYIDLPNETFASSYLAFAPIEIDGHTSSIVLSLRWYP